MSLESRLIKVETRLEQKSDGLMMVVALSKEDLEFQINKLKKIHGEDYEPAISLLIPPERRQKMTARQERLH